MYALPEHSPREVVVVLSWEGNTSVVDRPLVNKALFVRLHKPHSLGGGVGCMFSVPYLSLLTAGILLAMAKVSSIYTTAEQRYG